MFVEVWVIMCQPQAKRLIGGERIGEHKTSNHSQVDNANYKISETATNERKLDDLRIKT